MDLSIIIVNWNSADFVMDCVASIRKYTHDISYEIIVVDNASSREDAETLKNSLPNITFLRSDDNIGFARANNLGFGYSAGDYVLLLNPDTVVLGPAISIMLREMKLLPKSGVVGCKLLNTDLSVQLSSIQRFPTILNQVLDAECLLRRWPRCPLWDISPLFTDNVKVAEVDVISGACMLLRRETFKQVGMLSDDYFMYAEDVDLSYKVHRAGYTNYYVGSASIVHHGGKSSSRQEVSSWATTMRYKATKQLFTKTRGRVYGALYRTAMGCMALVRLLLLATTSTLGDIVLDRSSRRISARKWKVVLKWAVAGDKGPA